MRKVVIFGQDFTIEVRQSNRDFVEIEGKRIIVNFNTKPWTLVLREFLANLLYMELDKIHHQIKKDGMIDLFGNLDFEIVERIDGKKQRIAKLEANKVLVKIAAVVLPKSALKYIVAHEIAHILAKRHSGRFWKTVGLICPDFKKSQKILSQYKNEIVKFKDFSFHI